MVYTIFKEVATMSWPGTKLYRARYFPGTDLYGEWSEKAAAATVERSFSNHAKFERCDRETWLAAHNGGMNGWCTKSVVDAFVHVFVAPAICSFCGVPDRPVPPARLKRYFDECPLAQVPSC